VPYRPASSETVGYRQGCGFCELHFGGMHPHRAYCAGAIWRKQQCPAKTDAGRGERAGLVFIMTFNADQHCAVEPIVTRRVADLHLTMLVARNIIDGAQVGHRLHAVLSGMAEQGQGRVIQIGLAQEVMQLRSGHMKYAFREVAGLAGADELGEIRVVAAVP
jgi:hypothetical protein